MKRDGLITGFPGGGGGVSVGPKRFDTPKQALSVRPSLFRLGLTPNGLLFLGNHSPLGTATARLTTQNR